MVGKKYCNRPCSFFFQDFSNDDTKLEYNVDADNGIAMEGYLFKRASNAFKTWNRYSRHTSTSNFMINQIQFNDKEQWLWADYGG